MAKVSMTTELKVPAFAPAGVPESDAMKAIQKTYDAGFENLEEILGG